MYCTFIEESALKILRGQTGRNKMKKFLFAMVIISGSVTTWAEDMDNRVTGDYPEMGESMYKEQKWRAGILTGFNSPKGDIGTTTELGITTAFQPAGLLGFGVDAGTSRLDDENSYQRTIVMVNALYNMGGDIPVLRTSYLGGGGGPIILGNKVNWGYAPVAGFDVPLSNKNHDFISLGLTARYLINPDTPNSLTAAAAVKYWF